MADEGLVIRGIHWRQVLPWTNIFRSFRIAIHLSKLVLGIALLLTIFFGGKILDGLWPARSRAVSGELVEYEQMQTDASHMPMAQWRQQQQQANEQAYADLLISYNVIPVNSGEDPAAYQQRVLAAAHNRQYTGDAIRAILHQRDDITVKEIRERYRTAVARADANYEANHDAAARDTAKANARADENAALATAYQQAAGQIHVVRDVDGEGIFGMFFEYEVHQVNFVVNAVIHNDWLGSEGVVTYVWNFFAVGPLWLLWHHTVFFVIFTILFLLAWALFGGAISRIAAVHVARDEKISVRQAMNFAVGKLLSFVSAPVIPIVIVIVIGLVMSVGALIGNIPYIGPVIVGALFILALIAGFGMTVVLIGTAGGFNLMYPTIAVEGSDSFDAISRSFSYIYARPWRMLFYTAVAIGYGAVTYVFVHMFIWLMLVLVHHFVGLGMFVSASNGNDLLSAMWPGPAGRLAYNVDFTSLNAQEKIGAALIEIWVMLLVSFLGAFAISLYFCANTIIYYLMRVEVDATELDDVYLEQSEDDLEPAPVGGMTTAAPAAVAVTTTTTTTVVTPIIETPTPEIPTTQMPPPSDTPPTGESPLP